MIIQLQVLAARINLRFKLQEAQRLGGARERRVTKPWPRTLFSFSRVVRHSPNAREQKTAKLTCVAARRERSSSSWAAVTITTDLRVRWSDILRMSRFGIILRSPSAVARTCAPQCIRRGRGAGPTRDSASRTTACCPRAASSTAGIGRASLSDYRVDHYDKNAD
jgi:hypothetical protein